jgi:hypothetical protein
MFKFGIFPLTRARLLAILGFSLLALVLSIQGSTPGLAETRSGEWNPANPMHVTRSEHSAVLLKDGGVLVAAGAGNLPKINHKSAEIFDNATGNWSFTGSLTRDRAGHTATLLGDGRVLAVGGWTYPEDHESSEIYDPHTGEWTMTGFMHSQRSRHTATLLLDGRVLIAGGSGLTTEVFDPTTETWSLTGELSTRRSRPTATLLPDGRVLIAGGWDSISSTPLNTAEIYDPGTGEWTLPGSMENPRYQHTATILENGRVLVAGGNYLFTAEIYDPETETWDFTGFLNTGRSQHTATLISDGKVLVVGGGNLEGFIGAAEIYDPSTGFWSPAGDLDDARYNHTASLLPDGRVLVAGGFSAVGSLTSVEIFTPFEEPEPPAASFTFSPDIIYVGEVVSFTNTTTGTEPISYHWDFGDGSTGTDPHPEHVYPAAGLYPVKLTATNAAGSDDFELNVLVNLPLPESDLSVEITVSPLPIYLAVPTTFTAVVTNAGPEDAAGVYVEGQMPPTIEFIAGENCWLETGILSCDLDTIEAGASKTAIVVLRFLQVGAFDIELGVFHDGSDSNPANNIGQVSILVQQNPVLRIFLPMVRK